MTEQTRAELRKTIARFALTHLPGCKRARTLVCDSSFNPAEAFPNRENNIFHATYNLQLFRSVQVKCPILYNLKKFQDNYNLNYF